MSRHITTSRAVATALAVTGASLVLTACGSAASGLAGIGQPSLSLAAPLTSVACTTTGACVTLGASGGASTPSTAAQIRNRKGVWSSLQVPAAPVGSFDTGSCGSSTCLFGGSQSSGELLWSVDANTGAVTSLNALGAGVLVRALSCVSDADCAVIDQTATNLVRLSFSTDGGVNWVAPRTLPWSSASSDVTLDCVSSLQCYAASSANAVVTLRETSNAGMSWRVVPTPTTWTSLQSLTCSLTCTALVSDATGSALATQTKTSWTLTPLSFVGASMSCATASTCMVVGHDADQSADMAQWHGTLRSVALTYVPTVLDAVACAPSVCVAIGVSTVVSLRP